MNILEFFNEWGGVGGSLVGSLLGLLGGAFGTWCSIRGTNGPKERAFVVKASVWTWIFLAVLLGLIFGLRYVLPGPYKPWAPLLILLIVPVLVIGIPTWNRRQAQIRAEEAQETSQGKEE
jgi:hypothetical protein